LFGLREFIKWCGFIERREFSKWHEFIEGRHSEAPRFLQRGEESRVQRIRSPRDHSANGYGQDDGKN
jgi:hypothetical protein